MRKSTVIGGPPTLPFATAGIEGAGWARWNEPVVASGALAEQMGRTPAHDLAGFAIKLRALVCEWDDDVEEHQLRRLAALAEEMESAGVGIGLA